MTFGIVSERAGISAHSLKKCLSKPLTDAIYRNLRTAQAWENFSYDSSLVDQTQHSPLLRRALGGVRASHPREPGSREDELPREEEGQPRLGPPRRPLHDLRR